MRNINLVIHICSLLAAATLFHYAGNAQEQDILVQSAHESIEMLYSGEIPEEEMAVRQEKLDELAAHPININSDRIIELPDQNLITEFQLNKLREYRFRYGPLLTLNELRYIEGWDESTCLRVMPFLEPMESRAGMPEKKPRKTRARQAFMIHSATMVPSGRGFIAEDSTLNGGQAHYSGSPWKIGLRYDIESGKTLIAGIRAEKDPGEEVFPFHKEYPVKMNFPDYLSGYVMIKPARFIHAICLGDYHIRFGRGITLSGSGIFKSWKDPFRQGSAKSILRQNTSMTEWGFFRGAAIEGSAGKFSGCLFYSMAKADPSGYRMVDSTEVYFTSFNASGYHRSQSEMEKRGILGENSYGGIVIFRGNLVKAGLAACFSRLSIEKRPTQYAYDQFDFSGYRNFHAGGFLEAYFRRSSAYCEFSLSGNKKLAFLAGWKSMLSSFIKLTMDIRHFPVDFHPGFHATGAGPYGSLSNETGILIGLEAGLPAYWTMALVADYARVPWISNGNDFSGHRYAVHVRSSKNAKSYSFYLSYTYRQGDETGTRGFTRLPVTNQGIKHQADMQLSALYLDALRYKTRVSYVITGERDGLKESGAAIQQEITCTVEKIRVKFSLGVILCHSDTYDSRIYLYEPAVLYASGSQVMYGRGIRPYVLLKWSPLQSVDFWVKAGITVYEDVTEIGSGWDETEGNTRTYLSGQLRIRI